MIVTLERFQEEQKGGMPPAVEGVSLRDQVVIVTGASTGIGYQAAKHFAIREPSRLILVCRTEEKGQAAVKRRFPELLSQRRQIHQVTIELKAETGFQNTETWTADLSSFASVRALKEKIDQLERLDILIENAGIFMWNYETTHDGWENTLQVNLLGPALHLVLHIPKLLKTAKNHSGNVPRVVIVTSDVHYWDTIPIHAIDAPNTLKFMSDEDNFNREKRYTETKTTFVRALQSHVDSVTCCAVNPGLCFTDISRRFTAEKAESYRKLEEELAFTAEEGSRQLVYAAIGHRDREEELKGGYVSFSKVQECSDFILSQDGQRLQKKLWVEVMEIVANVDGTTEEIIGSYLS
ncbi:hypothetical protein V5O48_006140 [Marasmius crinis-equi]|uniref:NAD(P)-binding protein n=1 Tax=Marasmius crinis-equi TaxID=585013 RepID=A0ABR3FKY1_9AGAR